MEPFEWVCSNCGKVCRRRVDRSRHERKCRKRSISNDGVEQNAGADAVDCDRGLESRNGPIPGGSNEFFEEDMEDEEDNVCTFGTVLGLDESEQQGSDTSSEENEFEPPHEYRRIELTEMDIGVENQSTSSVTEEEFNVDRLKESMNVTLLQKKAAMYILSSGASAQGLSIKNTQAYLESLEENGEVRRLWNSGLKFWKDHDQRQKQCLPLFGRWCKRELPPYRSDMPAYVAYIRELPQTIVHVIESTRHIMPASMFDDATLIPSMKYDSEGRRILSDFFSSNDMICISKVLGMRFQSLQERPFVVPVQLFIDKANVTRLNKRSMYPVVMYILCFSRSIRRKVAVNVAFIPIVTNLSSTGRRISAAVAKSARCAAIQKCLELLLDPIQQYTHLTARFPDGKKRRFLPFLLSVVADIPEVAVLLSARYGLKTAFPCPRCYMPLSDVIADLLPANERTPIPLAKTSRQTRDIYQSVSALPTKKEQEHYLKSLSLRLPCSSFLYRWECYLDAPGIQENLRTRNMLPEQSEPFGLSSLMRFESLHNFDWNYC